MEDHHMQLRHPRSRLWAATTVVAVVAATGTAIALNTLSAQAATAGCRVSYSVASQWQGGFTGNVSLTNLGDPVTSWTLTWSFSAGQTVTQAWSASVTVSGGTATAKNASYNGSLATNASTSFGFNGSWNGSNPVPTSFAMNGTTCTGSTSGGGTSAAPVTTAGSGTTSQPPVTSGAPSTSGAPVTNPPINNPLWGKELPPAGSATSHAYDIIISDDSKGYTPTGSECSKAIHARYWAYGPDGKVYPTWHPAKDTSGCSFGHEHGDDPRTSDLFATVGWPAFGYVSEVQSTVAAASSQRHEDHVGHKVLAVNNSNVIQGDNGTSLFPPSGTTIATCDILLKFHQGTHSPDAFTNNIHELLFNQRCQATNGGAVIEARYSGLIAVGRPGGFSPSECPGFGGAFINVGTPVPADSPSDTRSLGRLISETGCVEAIRQGKTHTEALNGQQVPFTVSDMDDFWFADVQVSGSGLNFHLAPLFYVVNPSRYYDPSKSDKNGRIVDLCYQNLAGGDYCNQVKQLGGTIAWNDPRSPFKGTLREYRPGTFSVQNSGSTTVYTDVYGKNASTTPFAGSIQQYFSGTSSTSLYVRGSTKDFAGSSSNNIHAPN
jgi:hypothetical protein